MPAPPLLQAALAFLASTTPATTLAATSPPQPSPPPSAQPPPHAAALSASPRCSACTAVAAALHARLQGEAPKNDLDWRGRVGPNGERRGVRLAYAVSEARLDALLSDLCTAGLGSAVWWGKEGGAGDSDVGVWATKGELPPPGWSLPASRAEREGRAKQLENVCGGLVGDWEEELGAALLKRGGEKGGGGDDADVGVLLCERLAKVCGPGEGGVAREEGGGGGGKDEL